jgi:hypothetical protein
MSDQRERDEQLEVLFAQLAPECDERAALKEAHRLLEHDLSRLADPLPPADFLQNVMARVASAPVPAPAQSEVLTAAAIVAVTLGLAAVAYVSTGTVKSDVGLAVAQFVIGVRETIVAMGSALAALWRTAAVPMVAALGMVLLLSLLGLKRLTSPATTSSRVMT